MVRIDRRSRATPAAAHVNALNRLLNRLGNGECDYVDGWRTCHPRLVAYTYFKQNIGPSRIDRVYLRSELMEESSDWGIVASGLHTDHHALRVSLGTTPTGNRDPGRWRMDPLLLKLQAVQDEITNALVSLPGDSPLNEWMTFKAVVKDRLQERARESHRAASKVQNRLNKRREKL